MCYPSLKFQFILIILFSLMFFKEVIVILSYMYCFWRNTPTYLPPPSNTLRTSPKHHIWTSFEGPSENLLRMLWGRLLEVPKFQLLSKLNTILTGLFRSQSSVYNIAFAAVNYFRKRAFWVKSRKQIFRFCVSFTCPFYTENKEWIDKKCITKR